MTYRLIACPLLLALACTDPGAGPDPTPTPRAPWGVPISGGTMLATRDGAHLVIADPDRDRVLSVALADDRVVATVTLTPGDEPGRLIEDGAGRVHVALRRGGALLTLDSAGGAHLVARRAACAEPRGLAWDAQRDVVHVACAGGELVTFPAAGGAPTRRLQLDRDLRDVVVQGDRLLVTRFRTAELLTLDASGAVIDRVTPPPVERFGVTDAPGALPEIPSFPAVAAVAWRTIGLADGRVLMTHQRQLQGTLGTTPDGYRGGCGGRAEAALTVTRPGDVPMAVRSEVIGALPVDVAVSPRGDFLAIAVAGSRVIHVLSTPVLDIPDRGEGCPPIPPTTERTAADGFVDDLGAPTSVAYTPTGALAIFYPELPGVVIRTDAGDRTVILPGDIGYDAGRAVFHRQTQAMLACASCHPEGREDGLVWDFADIGRRRTQSLAGHLLDRAPYHWSGDLGDLQALMVEVFTGRMSGGELTASELGALGPWLDHVTAPAPSAGDPAAIARGKALFDSTEVGCAACHGGALLTSNGRYAVGTGEPGQAFKAPSLLGVASRAPFMHDGCAATLLDRFGPCGGGDLHGHTSQLDAAQLDDLIAYLSSL